MSLRRSLSAFLLVLSCALAVAAHARAEDRYCAERTAQAAQVYLRALDQPDVKEWQRLAARTLPYARLLRASLQQFRAALPAGDLMLLEQFTRGQVDDTRVIDRMLQLRFEPIAARASLPDCGKFDTVVDENGDVKCTDVTYRFEFQRPVYESFAEPVMFYELDPFKHQLEVRLCLGIDWRGVKCFTAVNPQTEAPPAVEVINEALAGAPPYPLHTNGLAGYLETQRIISGCR